MKTRFIAVLLLSAALSRSEIVDRIAISVSSRIIKDSDIDQDLRITAFLNHQRPAFDAAARKAAASRLLDQTFIRNEIALGEYEVAPVAEAQALLASLKKSRYADDAAYKSALASYGISEEDLKDHLLWQMTALHFIDLRFRPAVLVSDDEIQNYFDQHRREMEAANPGKPATLAALHDQIQQTLTGEAVNRLLFDWLERRRKAAKIVYLEESLK